MLKKVVRDITILFCFVVLWASTSRSAMGFLSDYRRIDKWWGKYDWLNGNLTGMSYLGFVKKFRTGEDYSRKSPVYQVPKNTFLLLHGDSHTRHPQLRDTDFVGVSEFHFVNEYGKYYFHADTAKRNILVIEIAENHVREYFSNLKILGDIADTSLKKTQAGIIGAGRQRKLYCSAFVPDLGFGCFFNPYINQNLEFNLVNYNFIMPVVGFKAALNYYLFRRASGNVIISKDGNSLFYKETVVASGPCSSFSPITADSIALLVNNLNTIYDHFRKEGFNEVYLSIIPSAVSIVQPEGYNNLIPMIQNDPRLRMKTIDIYSVFKNSNEVDFLPGDTHWNNNGFNKWLKKVNGILAGK